MLPIKNFGDSSYITGTAEPKVVKFCIQVGYINYSKRMTSPTRGRGYGHVSVLKFCRDAARRVVLLATSELLVFSCN